MNGETCSLDSRDPGCKSESALAANRGKDYLSRSLLHSDTITHEYFSRECPLGRTGRVLVALWGVFLLAGFLVAFKLEPDARGYGTHQSLGLPPCSIRVLFGIPCPSCGMTTSFSHFTKGSFLKAAEANFAGFLLAGFCAVQIPWCLASCLRGRMWGVSRPEILLIWVLLIIFTLSLLQWLIRVFP